MKKESVNTFSGGQDGGMMLDLHPSTTPNTVLTDNLNGTFITYNGNEYSLQNDRGNFEVAALKKDYIPIGAKEYNGIIYIVSVNMDGALTEDGKINVDMCTTEIGTYPGVDWSIERNTVGEAKGKLNYGLYTPLCNYKAEDAEEYGEFSGVHLGYSTLTPVTIEIEPSYDGSVNLILTDGRNPVRIINSGFSVLPNNEYKLIKRNQTVETNAYDGTKLHDLNLIRTTHILTNIDLLGVAAGGQLKGGNYTFYLKFGDADYNQTDIVAESGIVSIFKGNDCTPSVISGTVLDERTDKMVHLSIDGLNHTYSKIYVYFSREYSDELGYRMTEYGALTDPFEMAKDGDTQDIWISGYEQTQEIDRNELLIDYHTFDNARAMAQQQNMLFLGNLGSAETFQLYEELRTIAATCIETSVFQEPVCFSNSEQIELGQVDFEYNKSLEKTNTKNNSTEDTTSIEEFIPKEHSEYYSTKNIYYSVGYWPEEWYRFGIVFVLKDGATTPVFNMRSGWFDDYGKRHDFPEPKNSEEETTQEPPETSEETIQEPPFEEYADPKGKVPPVYGVFKTPRWNVFKDNEKIYPIKFRFSLDQNVLPKDVIGYFYVRQKRIPTTLCQGLSMGIDMRSHLPVTWNGKRWITQSFLSLDRSQEVVHKDDTGNTNNQLRPTLRYNSNSTSPAGDINNISEVTEPLAGGLLYQNRLVYEPTEDTTSIEAMLADTNAGITVYDKDDDLDGSKKIYVYVFKLSLLIEKVGDKYQFPVPEERLFYYVSNNENGLAKFVGKIFYFSEQEPNGFYAWSKKDVIELRGIMVAAMNAIDKNNETHGDSPADYWKKFIAYKEGIEEEDKVKRCALLTLDPCIVSTVRSVLDGSKFELQKEFDTTTYFGDSDTPEFLKGNTSDTNGCSIKHLIEQNNIYTSDTKEDVKCVFIPSNTKIKEVDGIGFSNVAGSEADPSRISYAAQSFGVRNTYKHNSIWRSERRAGDHYRTVELTDSFNTVQERMVEKDSELNAGFNSVLNVNILRGLFTPYVGTNKELTHGIWSIRINDIGEYNAWLTRKQDESPYYTVSKRIGKDEIVDPNNPPQSIPVCRGDCFTNTVSMRIIRNFIDPNVPISDNILDFDGWDMHVRRWGDYQEGQDNAESDDMKSVEWNELNSADVNTVDLGYWVTYKCLSSYNLGLRAEDSSNVEELKLMGSPRSFYPINSGSTATGNKMEESFILNDGYSATVSAKVFTLFPNVPYTTSEFANRIMFSNIQVDGAYTNGYRIFQGMSFKDYDKQYGAITKLVPWDNNLLVIMEHGVGIVGVNEQALMQTSTGDAIHIYGHGVLSDHMQIVSPDYGSKYEHSVIRTPIGVYGIDTDARKVWRCSTSNGFQTLSDMHIETYLNDELDTNKLVDMPLLDVRTHYNDTKGDLMFTFYRKDANLVTREELVPKEDQHVYVNTSGIEVEPGATIIRAIDTNIDGFENQIYSEDDGIATVSVNLDNNTLTITAVADGVCSICCGKKKIPVKVLNEREIAEKEQEQAAQASNTIVVTETDPETGEEITVVKSNTIIYAISYNNSIEVGEDATLRVGFKNNKSNLTLEDCKVEVISDGEGAADIVTGTNSVKITPTADGKIKIKVSHPDATGFETNWISISTPVFHILDNPAYYDGDTFMLRIARGQYSESIYYYDATQPVTVNIEDSNIAAGGTNSDSDLLWFYGKHLGDTNCTVTCGDSVVTIIVSVYEHPYLQGLQFYDGEEEIDQMEGFTMQVGETKDLTFKTIPEDLSITTYSGKVVLDDNNPNTSGETVASLTAYSFGGRYCSITAQSAGTIKLKFVMHPHGDSVTTTNTIIPITVYE